jgi:hypothetical protein
MSQQQLAAASPDAAAGSRADPLTFEAPYLVEKLLKERIITSEAEARALFREVKRYFFLSRSDESRIWEMYSSRIDEVWHQFVLFTRQYFDFCSRYYGGYLPHSPSNAPDSPKNDPQQGRPVATFPQFRAYYEQLFGEALPDCWYDEKSVGLHRRIIDFRVGQLVLMEDGDLIQLVDANGNVVFAVNSLAAEAMFFIADVGNFYVRELPGDLEDDEKIALISTLVQQRLLRLGS